LKQVQRLTGLVASLSRFIGKTAKKCLPFFKLTRKIERGLVTWNDECHKAFDGLKASLQNPPLLDRPRAGELLFVYLAVSETTISSVIVRAEGTEHRPLYCINRVLHGPEEWYSAPEKMALFLVSVFRKCHHYFQAHPIVVLTNIPIRKNLQQPQLSGRMVRWFIELFETNISHKPRPGIKA